MIVTDTNNNKIKIMPTTIAKTSIETVSQLIRKEFDSLDLSLDYIYGKAQKLIDTAIDFGLYELANEMTKDLRNG